MYIISIGETVAEPYIQIGALHSHKKIRSCLELNVIGSNAIFFVTCININY